MDAVWIPVVAALVGAALGSMTSIVAANLRGKADLQRARSELAVRGGLEEYKISMSRLPAGASIMPLACFIDSHYKFLQKLEKGSLSEEDVKSVYAEMQQTSDAFRRFAERGKMSAPDR